jgi:hypothetical protein
LWASINREKERISARLCQTIHQVGCINFMERAMHQHIFHTGRHVLAAGVAFIMTASAQHASADSTVHIDLPANPLGIFGVQWNGDFISPVSDIQDGIITSVRFHLEFNTLVSPPFGNAANLAIDFQPPAGDLPMFTLTGAQLGWSGTGSFVGDFETDALNFPILDFPKGAELALWFVQIRSTTGGPLGGQLTNSYIEVDVQTIPAPSALALLLIGACGARRGRRK